MSQKIFKKSAIALAIAVAMPQVATAADISGDTDVAGNWIGPISQSEVSKPAGTLITPTFGYGKKVKIVSTTGGKLGTNAAAGDIYAFYFDASGNFLFADLAGKQVDAIGADNITLTLTGNTAAKKVAFVIATTIANDNVGGSDAGFITAIKAGTGSTATRIKYTITKCNTANLIADGTGAIAGGDTGAEATAIAAEITSAGKFDLTSYPGPTITLGQMSNTANTDFIGLTFDHPMKAVNDNTDVSSDIDILKADNTAVTGTPLADGTFADGYTYIKIDAGGSFTGTAATVKTKNAANNLVDLAGNSVEFPKTVSLVEFATPALKSVTAPAVLSTTAGTVNNLYGSGDTGDLTVKVLMNEPIDWSNLDTTADLTALGSKTTFLAKAGSVTLRTTTAGSGSVATLTVKRPTGAATGDKFTIDTTGALKYKGSPVTVEILKHGSTNIQTANGAKTLASDIAATAVKAGINQSPTIATRDDDANGLIDGVTVDYKQAVGTPAVVDYTLKTNFGGTARDITFTTAKLTGADSKVKLVITNPANADWNENGTAGESADSAKYVAADFNTGKSGAAVKYVAAKNTTSSTLKYANVYDAATGELKKVDSLPAATTITDGAAPVLTKVTRLTRTATEGSLNLVFSEALSGTPETKDVDTNGSSLVLLATNAGDTNISDVFGAGTVNNGAKTTTTISNDTATFYNVDNSLLTTLTSVGVTAGNTTLKDAAGNLIPAQTKTPEAVTADTTTAPSLEKAVAVESSTGFIKTVLLTLTEPVTANGSNKASDFTVNLGGIAITPSTVSVSGKVLTITLPGEGIRRDLVTGNGTIAYTNSSPATTDYRDSDNNKLADFSATALEVPRNSEEIYVQEISATLTTDGSTQVAQGTMVRADLIKVASDATTTFKRGDITVPCGDCSGKTMNIALENGYSAISTDIATALKEGKKTIPVIVEVKTNANRGNNYSKHAVLKSGAPASIGAGSPSSSVADNTISYNADLDVKTGVISGQVKGKVTFSQSAPGSFKVLDTSWQTVDNGKIRMSVGVTDAEKAALTGDNAFVLVSVKQPADAEWTLVTSPVPSFSNYLPFKDELSTSGTIAGALGTVDLSKIETIEVANTNVWQLLAVNGEISQDTNKDLDVDRFFVTIEPSSGDPITLWHADTADKDMAFTLKDSKVDTAFEASQKTVSKIGLLNGGDGLAFENMATLSGRDYLKIATATEVNKASKIFVPVTGNDAKRSIKKGWQLMTAVVDISEANFSASNIEAVIKVGGGNDAQSWFSGAANNQLNMMKSDTAYFVYFGSDTADFKFGK